MNISQLGRFLIHCSGSSKDVLSYCTDGEYTKHIGIGGLILFTAIFSIFSSYYTISLITPNIVFALMGGCLWGLMIFNLDRYLVSSIRKDSLNFFSTIFTTALRILLGLLIAFTLAHPIELRIFESEITEYLVSAKQKEVEIINSKYKTELTSLEKRKTDELNRLPYNKLLNIFNDKKERLIKEYESYKDLVNTSKLEYLGECDGTRGTKIKKDGPECKRKKGIYESENNHLDELRRKVNSLYKQEQALIQEPTEVKKTKTKFTNEINNLIKNRVSTQSRNVLFSAR